MNANQSNENSFAAMLNESLEGRESLEGKVVKGIVVGIKSAKAVIDIGLKSEGRLSLEDIKTLKGSDEVKIGDEIDVFVEKFEDKNGEPILSVEKAKKEAVWKDLEKHMEDGTAIEGTIMGRTKGGFSVDVNGTAAFLPGSQVDLRIVRDIAPLLNLKQPFKILKMDKVKNNIVVSRRAVLEASRAESRAEALSSLEEGMVLSGVVKNITEYGAFVDIGGVDGLLHVTDMSWKRISSPADFLKVGENIQVQIVKFSKETGRISLGMKQLVKTPWEGIENRYVVGGKYKGKAVNITEYGVFVELEECIEGMIYMTELDWTKKNIAPNKVVNVGDEIEVMVLGIDLQKRKISLGLKQCKENPWKKFAEEHAVGSRLEGVVRNVTEFGIFVGVNDNIDGMVHMSEISWNMDNVEGILKDMQRGQKIEVIVLSVDPEKERISLGIKQVKDDPAAAANDVKKGDAVVAEITGINDMGIEVKLENGYAGFIKKGDLSSDRARQRTENYAVKEKVEAMVLGFERANRKFGLSIKALEIQREKEAMKQFGSADSGASLGDILGVAIKQKEEKE